MADAYIDRSTPPAKLTYSEKTLSEAFRYYAAGSSTHQVAMALKVTMPEAEDLQVLYVNGARSRLATDRIAKRQAMRNKLGTAAGFLESVYTGQHPAISGKETVEGKLVSVDAARLAVMRDLLSDQIAAARAVLSAAKEFAKESLLDILVERKDETPRDAADTTIFEFGSVWGEDGGSDVILFPKKASGE